MAVHDTCAQKHVFLDDATRRGTLGALLLTVSVFCLFFVPPAICFAEVAPPPVWASGGRARQPLL